MKHEFNRKPSAGDGMTRKINAAVLAARMAEKSAKQPKSK